MDAFAEFRATAGVVHQASGNGVAFVVFREIFINAGGDQLFHAQTDLAFLEIDGEDLRLDDLSDSQHVVRGIDAFFGGDIADVDHTFDALGKLYEGAELRQIRDRSFDRGSDLKALRYVGPGVTQRLLESE